MEDIDLFSPYIFISKCFQCRYQYSNMLRKQTAPYPVRDSQNTEQIPSLPHSLSESLMLLWQQTVASSSTFTGERRGINPFPYLYPANPYHPFPLRKVSADLLSTRLLKQTSFPPCAFPQLFTTPLRFRKVSTHRYQRIAFFI